MRFLSISVLFATLAGCGGTAKDCSDSSLITVFWDEDRDGHGDPATQTLRCEVSAQWVTTSGDCDDLNSAVSPTGVETCDGLDNDCDSEKDEGLRTLNFYRDADEDGFGNPEDVDFACAPPEGFVENPSDCDDTDPLTFPQAGEFCDEKDNDCDGLIDDADPDIDPDSQPIWYYDGDSDGYGDADLFLQRCEQPPNTVENPDDCDDSTANRSPVATEVCNGIDDDCDGHVDDSDDNLDTNGQEVWFYDGDGDGFGDLDNTVVACDAPWFYVSNSDDCDDNEALLGDAPTGFWVQDGDGDGYGTGTVEGPFCDAPDTDWVLEVIGDDCDDTDANRNPGETEVCDGIDNDCDSLIDDSDPDLDESTRTDFYRDADGDTFGNPDVISTACDPPMGHVTDNTDCDDGNIDVNPDATEICNDGVDDDCNDLADAADPGNDPASEPTWWLDFDDDGFGGAIEDASCSQPLGYVNNSDDCDDNDPLILGNINWLADTDGDGFGDGPILGPACTAPQPNAVPESNGTDCDDADVNAYPGAIETCGDSIDQDCDLSDLDCFPDTCAETAGYPALTTGTHIFADDLSAYADDVSFSAGNNCTGQPTDGGEAFVPVVLESGEAITVQYRNDGDASAYFLLDCAAPTDNDCYLAGDGNLSTPVGGAEDLIFVNTTGAQISGYMVLDCNGTCSGFDLSIDISTPAPLLPSNCTDSDAWPVYGTMGLSMFGTLDGMAGNISLANGNACTGGTTSGIDAILPIELLDGETIDVNYTQIQGDASVYLAGTCVDPEGTCLAASDNGADGVQESLSYTNTSGATETLRLYLDCFDGQFCSDFSMTLSIY